ncbi:MAG: glucosamine-6-phosphate deaminase [Anaerolineaceae bacterium]|nr:glucosamine-6-phosphate deaminase [Anaerolineaceae bacterium]
MTILRTLKVEKMPVFVFDSPESLGEEVANEFEKIINSEIINKGEVSVILATGNSQLAFIEALRKKKNIPWDKVYFFHMDEYLGMSEEHPASFQRYIKDKLVKHVHPRAFFGIQGDAANVNEELARYKNLLLSHKPSICVLGIGENGHLAFNDPPADFETEELIHVVNLDQACRIQQVNEGHFPNFDTVPAQAITLTIPALLSADNVFAVVPEMRKADAVATTLYGAVTPNCPASILRTKNNTQLYLDRNSALKI